MDSNSNKAKKLLNISLLQVFGILCVLLGHSVHIFSSFGWYFHQAPINTTCNIIHHMGLQMGLLRESDLAEPIREEIYDNEAEKQMYGYTPAW